MSTPVRARLSGVGAEAALASLAGAATFAAVAVAVATIESDVPILLLAIALLGGVVYVARHLGAPFAVLSVDVDERDRHSRLQRGGRRRGHPRGQLRPLR